MQSNNLPYQKIHQIIDGKREQFKNLAQANGILYKYPNNGSGQIDHCPVSLFPKLVPLYILFKIDKKQIQNLQKKQFILQKLIDKMSHNFEYQESIMKGLSQTDSFTRNMLQIQAKVEQCPTRCKYNFAFVRNDFMHNESNDRWLQVEYNCIAVSFGFISDLVQDFHQMLLESHYKELNLQCKIIKAKNKQIFVDGVRQCYNHYGQSNSIILCVVSDFEGNCFDQLYLELELAKQGIQTMRVTFKEMKLNLNRDQNDGTLYYADKEVFFVYFRYGYTFQHYSEMEWEVRETIELSKAIKCPSLNIQIVNFKKFQEYIQHEQELIKFISKEESDLLRENFCQIWGFDDLSRHNELIEMIQKNSSGFVLKPQREGGGNNFYGDEIIEELNRVSPKERSEYTLMERIKPQPHTGFMMKRGEVEVQECISELGVYGYFLSEGDKVLRNEIGGYLVRTKQYLTNEGGVAAGYAVIDSLGEVE